MKAIAAVFAVALLAGCVNEGGEPAAGCVNEGGEPAAGVVVREMGPPIKIYDMPDGVRCYVLSVHLSCVKVQP